MKMAISSSASRQIGSTFGAGTPQSSRKSSSHNWLENEAKHWNQMGFCRPGAVFDGQKWGWRRKSRCLTVENGAGVSQREF